MRVAGSISSIWEITPCAASSWTAGIFNTLGQRIRHLESGRRQRGSHQVTWYGRDDSGREVTSGLYIATLRGTQERVSRRLLLVR